MSSNNGIVSDVERKYWRPIRSYVRREGKLTRGQKKAINQYWPKYGVRLEDGLLDFGSLFGRHANTVLEIGFGNGLSLADMAEQNLQCNYFGIEVYRPGVGSLLVQIQQRELHNIRVSKDDAVEVIDQQLPTDSLHQIQIFFPDPWHKKRHHKRRLIQSGFIDNLVTKLKLHGQLHIATDWFNYAEHILQVLTACPALRNTTANYVTKPQNRPVTKYEARGRRVGNGIWNMVFEKVT